MIDLVIRQRGIDEVVHFTTINGVIGILDSGFLKSRARIADDQRLEFILKLNSIRRDEAWLDYVNLSITNINNDFFKSSSKKASNVSWVILSFDPEILTHEGVTFTSTNNVYHDCVLRGTGVSGLENMFLPQVRWGYYGSVKVRGASHRSQEPTDNQAEVLYPAQVSIGYLKKIYVSSYEDQDHICGLITALNAPAVDVLVVPEKFEVM